MLLNAIQRPAFFAVFFAGSVLWLGSLVVLLGLFLPAYCMAVQSPALQRVLVLYSDERLLPANVIFDHSFSTTLQAGTSKRTEFHSEFLDVSRFSGEAQQGHQRDFLREK